VALALGGRGVIEPSSAPSETGAVALESPPAPGDEGVPSEAPLTVAYVMSRFPRLTETFILFEILALERNGCRVEIYPLLRERRTRVHPDGATVARKALDLFSREARPVLMHAEAAPLTARAHYGPLLSRAIVGANLRQLVRRPVRYLGTWLSVVRRNVGSLNFLLAGLAILPRAAYIGQEMQRSGVTHVHAHFANHPALAAWVIHRLYGIPYSFTGHGADLQVDQHMLREKVTEAAFVRAISADGQRFIREHAPPGSPVPIEVVPCGIDVTSFAAPSDDGEQHAFTILCVATLYEVKGHEYLFQACAELVGRGLEVRCLLAGDGPDRAALEARVTELGLAGVVSFLGQQSRDDIVRLMHRADVLAVPSVPTSSGRREGLPVVTMEAMAAGLPVVASALSGIPEIVEDGVTGLLVPPRDGHALATALERIAADAGLRGRLAAAGHRRVEERYDLDVVSGRLIGMFRRHSLTGPSARRRIDGERAG
jgi:glycosyltransferase involved in cell wall biosynthesis